jgi:hypothetical protein
MTSSGGREIWREEGEARMLAGSPYRRLIRRRADLMLCYGWRDIFVKPSGREVGEIPAQSRYGERPVKGASPVADLTVHARTFERKVGRTVRSTG